jgi:hypothetical protein
MLELPMLDNWPEPPLAEGLARANRLYWSLTWGEVGDVWYVRSGEDVLLRTDAKETMDAFLHGMAVAYSIIPDPIFEQVERDVRRMAE